MTIISTHPLQADAELLADSELGRTLLQASNELLNAPAKMPAAFMLPDAEELQALQQERMARLGSWESLRAQLRAQAKAA